MTASKYLGSGRSFVDTDDTKTLQDLVANGYRHCVRRTYFLRLVPPASSLEPEGQLISQGELQTMNAATFSDGWCKLQESLSELSQPPLSNWFAAADVGFSLEGLRKLGIRQNLLEVFKRKSPAFSEGAHARAHRHLLDTGESDPTQWAAPYGSTTSPQAFDIVIFLHLAVVRVEQSYSVPKNLLLEAEGCLIRSLAGAKCTFLQALSGWWIETAAPLNDQGREHFGYRDGITQPRYERYENTAQASTSSGVRETHALGEVLLGHKRNEGDNPYAELGLTRRKNGHWEPSQMPREYADTAFFLNSSFGVLRRMEQRVEAFEAWIEKQAMKHFPQDAVDGLVSTHGKDDPYALRKAWIKAKLLGRTVDGRRLTPSMAWADFDFKKTQSTQSKSKPAATETTPLLGQEGGFHQRDTDGRPTASDDSQGRGCPLSSHIRRMNPQDDPVAPFIHRPLLRRGLPYSDSASKPDKSEVGLAGLFICSDLVEQFEHLVGVWAQHRVMGITEPSQCRDPLIGNHNDAPPRNTVALTTPEGRRVELALKENFVITRGSAYIWLPSKDTLTKLGCYT
jgi:deferrochelatase/peroxidase EfeB